MSEAVSPSISQSLLAWHSPPDLTLSQRWSLGLVVLAAHAGAAWYLSQWHAQHAEVAEPVPLMVSMIAPEPQAAAVAPAPPPPQVKPPTPAPVVLATKAPSKNTLSVPPEPPKVLPKTEAAPTPSPVAPAAAATPLAPVADAPPVAAVPAAPLPPKQITASAVRYIVPPQQVYPDASRRLGESGKVALRVLVDEHGRAVEVQITQSSGYSRLDQAAVAAVKAARFQPYLENGVARAVWAPAPFTYELQD